MITCMPVYLRSVVLWYSSFAACLPLPSVFVFPLSFGLASRLFALVQMKMFGNHNEITDNCQLHLELVYTERVTWTARNQSSSKNSLCMSILRAFRHRENTQNPTHTEWNYTHKTGETELEALKYPSGKMWDTEQFLCHTFSICSVTRVWDVMSWAEMLSVWSQCYKSNNIGCPQLYSSKL